MTAEPDARTSAVPDAVALADARKREAWTLAARLFGVVSAVAATLFTISHFYRAELDAAGHYFVSRFGYAGVVAGSFFAEVFSLPIPPQAYMLAAMSGGAPHLPVLVVVSVSSMAGGFVGYHLARRLSKIAFFVRRLDRSRQRVDGLFERWGAWAVVVASVSPIPFSMLCYLAGVYRMPPRLLGALLVLRLPRILLFYVVFRLSLA